jgi:DnaJ-class molecular chaperone
MLVPVAKATQAAEALGLTLESVSAEAVSTAYRQMSKQCHPDSDKHDPELWARISWAKECLTHWLERLPKPEAAKAVPLGQCRACDSTGRVAVGRPRGFSGKPLTMMCVMCNGTGNVELGASAAYQKD